MKLAKFDLNLLCVFEALHVHRNTSLAAEALGATQPAVSNALAQRAITKGWTWISASGNEATSFSSPPSAFT